MIGETLGGYRITRKLGEGGMGVVYEAEHIFLGRRAAIKALLPELSSNAEAVGRFFIEAKTAAMLNHPGLVDIYDQGHTEGPNSRVFIIMEFLEGEDLGTVLRREQKIPLKRALQIARQVASALAAVHQKGIVHRDLKPDNLFLVPVPGSPGSFRVKVLDFGIAKLTGPENKDLSVKTRTGSVLGTPSYMSPEQCRGHGKIDWRSDIYSLGCIIQEMIVGHPPFTGSGYGEVLAQHIYEPPPPLRTLDPTVPTNVEALVLKTLVKQPDQRLQTMDELAAAIDGMFNTPSMLSMQGVGGPPGAYDSAGMLSGGSGMSALPVGPPTTSSPMAATMPPQEAIKRDTTMRKAASEVIRAERGHKKKSFALPLVMALGAAGVIGVIAFVAVGSSGGSSTAAATPTAPAPEAPPPADPPRPEPVAVEAPKPEPVAVEAPKPEPPSAVKPAEPVAVEAPKPEPVAVVAPKPEPPKPEPPKPEPAKPEPPKPVAVVTPKPEPPSTVKPAEPPPAVKPAEPPKPVVAAVPAKVPVKIGSDPAGAEIFTADGARVGKTPFETQLAPGKGKLAYVLKLKGYKDGRLEIPADKGGAQQVKLEAEPKIAATPPPVAPAPPKPLVSKPSGGKKPKPVKDGVVNPFK